ncbi:MAG: hypothetical protein IJ333_06890 [Clostridia bacterium]|nr:hypothetical protein [Clostridia bacterium]
MLFLKSKVQKELDFILAELKNFLANNYKDQAHSCRKQLGEKAERYYQEGKLTHAQYRHYQQLYKQYTDLMKDYHH